MKTIIVVLLLLGFVKESYSQSSWYSQNSGTTNNLNKIYLKNTISGQALFIVGNNGTILRSYNQGLIWETINSNTNSNLYSIDINYNDTGYAVGSNGTILRSIDGGSNWEKTNSNTFENLKDVKRINNNLKFIITGDNGIILKFQNGTWNTSYISTRDLKSINLRNNNIFIVGNNGTVLRTSNFGENWISINSGTNINLNHISDVGLDSYIVGDSGLALSMIGFGIHLIKSSTYRNLNSIYADYNSFFWICGDSGTIIRNWQPQFINFTTNLNSILILERTYGWAIGEGGTILFSNTITSGFSNYLNSNNISSLFSNNGSFNNPFEWPKGESKFARYSSGTLIGALVNGDTLVTVCDYTSEYLPGYTDVNGIPNGNGSPEFRVYKMVYGITDSNRIYWPNELLGNSDQGAPVFFDSSTMSYKPIDYGNQTMFYSYTDSYDSSHTNYSGRTAPLKIDIKQINYSFNQPEDLKNIIYQEYRIINRSTSVWTNAYVNFWTDDDLGSAGDDAEGVDTNFRLAYTYNFTNNDGQYGANPPAVGFAIMRAPLIYTGNNNDTVFYCEGKRKRIKVGYKEIRLGSTAIYHDDSNQPVNYRESYNAIRGLQNNGSQYINPITNQPTTFVYSGDPVTGAGWNGTSGSDMRFYQGFGPMNINPGDTQIIVMAQMIARGNSNLNSITKLREAAVIAKQYYDNCFEDVKIGINNNSQNVPADFYLSQNYPNPFNPGTNLEFGISNLGFVSLKVFDMLGKEVATLVNENKTAGKYSVEFDGSNFASGVYFYSLYINESLMDTKRMLLIK